MSIESFLDYLRFERNYSEKTIVHYRIDLSQFEEFFKSVDDTLKFKSVDADIVRRWIVLLMKKNYASTSVNRKLSSLRSYYRYLQRNGKVDVSPLCKLNGPKNKKPLPVFLRESDMDRLLDDIDFGDGFVGCRNRMIIEMFYATGIRRSELIGLKDSDVDLVSSQIKVIGKRNKQRIIPFGEELKEDLLSYINIRGKTLFIKPDAFFVRENGERLYDGLVYSLVKKSLMKVVSLKKRSPHVLRHTFATVLLNNETKLEAVKELLGHGSISATEIYVHTTSEELKKVYKQAHPRA